MHLKRLYQKYRWDCISIAIIIAFGLTFFMYAPWMQGIGGDGGDGHYALWAACARMWNNGEIPLWNPYQWGGYSSVGHIQEVFYPILVLLEFILWDDTTQTLSYSIFPMYIAIHFCIGALGVYVLGRTRKKTPLVSCSVALLTTASGCFTFGVSWAYIFGGYCWIPWLIWALYELIRTEKRKWIAISGAILSMIALCSVAQGALFAVMIYAILYAVVVWENRKNPKKCIYHGLRFALSGFIGMGIGAVELFPFLETNMNAFRFIPGMDLSGNKIKIPLALFKADVVTAQGINDIFGAQGGVVAISLVALLLLIFGMFVKQNEERWLMQFSKILMFGSFAYCVGLAIPDVFWYIPGFNSIREPLLYGPFILIAGSIVMFEGMETLVNILDRKKTLSCTDGLEGVNTCGGWIILVTLVSCLPHMMKGSLDYVIKGVVIACILIVLFKKKLPKIVIRAVVMLVMIVNVAQWVQYNTSPAFITANQATERVAANHQAARTMFDELDAEAMDGKDETARFLRWSSTDVLPANIAGAIGEYDCFAYCNPIYDKTYYVYQYLGTDKKCQLQNIKYILFGDDADDKFKAWMEAVLARESKIIQAAVYPSYDSTETKQIRYIDTGDMNLGSAWIVNEVLEYKGSDYAGGATAVQGLFEKINDPNFDLSRQAYLDIETINGSQKMNFKPASKKEVTCTEYRPNRITYQVNTDADGILTTAQFAYPGWKVKINGKKRDILQLNYAFMGTKVDEDTHLVEFYYRPDSLLYGCITALVALGVMAICVLTEFRTNNRRSVKDDEHYA